MASLQSKTLKTEERWEGWWGYMCLLRLSSKADIRYILDHPEGITFPDNLGCVPWNIMGLLKNPMKLPSGEGCTGEMNSPLKDKIEFICKYFSRDGKLIMSMISGSPGITSDIISMYPTGLSFLGGTHWDIPMLCTNPNLTQDVIRDVITSRVKESEYERKKASIRDPLFNNKYTYINKVRKDALDKIKEGAARSIWYKGWLPYYYSPKRVGKGFDKDIEIVRTHLKTPLHFRE